MSFRLKVKRLGEFLKTSRLYVKKETLDQYLDLVSVMSVASLFLPVYVIVRKHLKTQEQTPLTKWKYVLVGDKRITEQVEHQIRRKLGEPIHPIFLMKWRYTEIEKIKKKEQFEKLKYGEKPIALYLCTSTNNNHSKEEFCLPDYTNDLPSKIERKNIIVITKAGDRSEKINTCVQKLCNHTRIQAIFDKSKVLELISDKSIEKDVRYEVALLSITIYCFAALIFIIRRKVLK